MIDDWQEMDAAPRNDPVLICLGNCEIMVGVQENVKCFVPGSAKPSKQWKWFRYKEYSFQGGRSFQAPKMWRPLPLPPKHLYERKLTADLLEKQVAELRK